MYDLTVDNIHEIFKRYGDVKKIAIFQKNNQWQALVQYPDHQVGIPPPLLSQGGPQCNRLTRDRPSSTVRSTCAAAGVSTCLFSAPSISRCLSLQSAAAAKQVLEGHAMFEGGANVLRLSYSVHRELNVKNSGEKSRDFSLPLGVPSVGYNHPTSHHHAPQGGFDSHGPRYQHGYADEAQVNGATMTYLSCSLRGLLQTLFRIALQ